MEKNNQEQEYSTFTASKLNIVVENEERGVIDSVTLHSFQSIPELLEWVDAYNWDDVSFSVREINYY